MSKVLILTKSRYAQRVKDLMPKAFIGTIHNEDLWMDEKWDIIISYCYGRKVKGDILKQNIYNLHPAPLPEYKGGDPYQEGADKVTEWAVTLHEMTDEYDEGEIMIKKGFYLPRTPNKNELWYVSHTFALNLLKTVVDQY